MNIAMGDQRFRVPITTVPTRHENEIAKHPQFRMLDPNKLYVVGFMARRCYSTIISCCTSSDYSHAGAAFFYRNEWWVTHSTPNPGKIVPIDEEQWRGGVIMVKLAEELESGWYEYITLFEIENISLSNSQRTKLYQKYQENSHKIYEESWMEVGYSALDCRIGNYECCKNKQSREQFFCSEWAAHFVSEYLELEMVESEYTPDDLVKHQQVKYVQTLPGPPQSTAQCCQRFFNFDS